MRVLRVLVPSVLILALSVAPVLGNGGKGKTTYYEATLNRGEAGSIEFSSELEAVLFRLNSVQGKYKVVRIKIDNRSRQALRLSAQGDRIELVFPEGGAPVQGILDLAARDARLWDSLPADLRQAVAYPRVVEANEEENVFVFIAKPSLPSLPRLFRYRIASLPNNQIIEIAEVNMAVAS